MRKTFVIALLALLSLAACKEKETENVPQFTPSLKVINRTIEAEATANDVEVEVISNIEWTSASDVDWAVTDPTIGEGDGKFTIKVAENTTYEQRKATVTVSGKDVAPIKITVSQKAAKKDEPEPEPGFSRTITAADISDFPEQTVGVDYIVMDMGTMGSAQMDGKSFTYTLPEIPDDKWLVKPEALGLTTTVTVSNPNARITSITEFYAMDNAGKPIDVIGYGTKTIDAVTYMMWIYATEDVDVEGYEEFPGIAKAVVNMKLKQGWNEAVLEMGSGGGTPYGLLKTDFEKKDFYWFTGLEYEMEM